MKSKTITQLILAALIACGGLAASIGLARLGEPQSVWLWCNMRGLCAR